MNFNSASVTNQKISTADGGKAGESRAGVRRCHSSTFAVGNPIALPMYHRGAYVFVWPINAFVAMRSDDHLKFPPPPPERHCRSLLCYGQTKKPPQCTFFRPIKTFGKIGCQIPPQIHHLIPPWPWQISSATAAAAVIARTFTPFFADGAKETPPRGAMPKHRNKKGEQKQQ